MMTVMTPLTNDDYNNPWKTVIERLGDRNRIKIPSGAVMCTIERMAETRGEARGRKSMILEFLNYRFGEFSPILTEKMNQLSIAQLESLRESVFGFTTIDELDAWLTEHSEV